MQFQIHRFRSQYVNCSPINQYLPRLEKHPIGINQPHYSAFFRETAAQIGYTAFSHGWPAKNVICHNKVDAEIGQPTAPEPNHGVEEIVTEMCPDPSSTPLAMKLRFFLIFRRFHVLPIW